MHDENDESETMTIYICLTMLRGESDYLYLFNDVTVRK